VPDSDTPPTNHPPLPFPHYPKANTFAHWLRVRTWAYCEKLKKNHQLDFERKQLD
jgi:hypothetical protein